LGRRQQNRHPRVSFGPSQESAAEAEQSLCPCQLVYFGVVESIADDVGSSACDRAAREKNGWSEEQRQTVLT
jgi:hypothetical protein